MLWHCSLARQRLSRPPLRIHRTRHCMCPHLPWSLSWWTSCWRRCRSLPWQNDLNHQSKQVLPLAGHLSSSCLELQLSENGLSPPLCRTLYFPAFFIFMTVRLLRASSDISSPSTTIPGANWCCSPEEETVALTGIL